MKKIVLIFNTILFVTSCSPRVLQSSSTFTKQNTLVLQHQFTPLTTMSKIVLMPPKIRTIDWKSSMLPIVQQILAIDDINDGSILLVSKMKNNTNGILQTDKATTILTNLVINATGKFQVIWSDKLNEAQRILGLHADNSLESVSKAIGLAKYLNAQYVLYSTAFGDVRQPKLNLQLILVRSGEIIWSGNCIAHEQYN